MKKKLLYSLTPFEIYSAKKVLEHEQREQASFDDCLVVLTDGSENGTEGEVHVPVDVDVVVTSCGVGDAIELVFKNKLTIDNPYADTDKPSAFVFADPEENERFHRIRKRIRAKIIEKRKEIEVIRRYNITDFSSW